MRKPDDPKRQDGFKDYPSSDELIVLGDDPDQDGPPMRAVNTARVLSAGKVGGVGVLAERFHEEERQTRGVNVRAGGVSGATDIMEKIAEIIRQQHPSTQVPV